MSNWTLTPDGLRTDEQLWADEYLNDVGDYCPTCGNQALQGPPTGCSSPVICTGPGTFLSCPNGPDYPAAICCSKCGAGWCKKCLGED